MRVMEIFSINISYFVEIKGLTLQIPKFSRGHHSIHHLNMFKIHINYSIFNMLR